MCEECQDLRERVEGLEADLDAMKQEREAYREKVLNPRLDDLATARDDAQRDRAELAATVDSLSERVNELTRELESLVGLAEDEGSTPAKRAADVRQSLIRQAREIGGEDDTTATMHYGEVKETLAQLGHDITNDPACFDAMDDAAEADGFWLEENKKQKNGRMVRALVVDTDALPSTGTQTPISGATNEKQGRGARTAPQTTD